MSEFLNDRRELPNSWRWVTIGEISEVIGGGTPSTTNPSNFGGDIPWITPADMSSHVGKTIAHGARSISEKGLDGSGARWLPKGTVLFSSRAPIGYVAVASQPVTTNQGFKSFVPAMGIDSDYLYYWLTSAKPLAEKLASGTTFLEISGAKAALIPFPIAPAAEQIRIVAKLEELLSDLDAGVDELKAVQKKVVQYRHSLLKAAVEGALTAEWRSSRPAAAVESGAALLARILRERRARWETRQLAKFKEQGKPPPKDCLAKYPEPVAPDTAGLPLLPQGWVWASLDQLVHDSSYGTSVKCSYESKGDPVLRIPNVVARKLDLNNLKFATQKLGLEGRDYLEPGDILIVRTNGSISLVGRAAEISEVLPGQFYFASYLLRVRCIDTTVIPRWISVVLASSYGRTWIEARASSSAGQHNISLSTLLTLPVPLAPIAEQSESLSSLETMLLSVVQQEQSTELSLKQSTAQRKNILQSAFSGQLVPQDPADEPASELLALIRNGRSERMRQPKIRKQKARKEVSAMASKLIDVLAETGDWVPAQEAFRRCGVADGALTDDIELLYAELRELDKAKRLIVESVTDTQGRKLYDRLKLHKMV